jgi:hypothetical protein
MARTEFSILYFLPNAGLHFLMIGQTYRFANFGDVHCELRGKKLDLPQRARRFAQGNTKKSRFYE